MDLADKPEEEESPTPQKKKKKIKNGKIEEKGKKDENVCLEISDYKVLNAP